MCVCVDVWKRDFNWSVVSLNSDGVLISRNSLPGNTGHGR